jgi:uncharacterized protein (DUF4415 family)
MAKPTPKTRKDFNRKNSHVKFGSKELDADEFSPLFARAHISIKIPVDVLDAYRTEAGKRGTKYQSLMNEVLQQAAAEFKLGRGKIDPMDELLALVDRSSAIAKRIKRKG